MPNQKTTPTNFVATVYGELTPLNNSAFSKARLKIFYKGLNRNGSYITDEVAEKLLASLPGTPIVGNFSGEKDDFEGHMPWSPEELKAYGFVPQDMNFSWEMSLDPDGVYRTYACTDIVLWTGRYPVASRIVGKSHSMELNPNTIEGEWVETDDDFYYQFNNAEFFGLCILGDDFEPCFEGSSFYELHKDKYEKTFSNEIQEMFSLFKGELDNANENLTGGQSMDDELENKPAEELEEEQTSTPEEQEHQEEEQQEETQFENNEEGSEEGEEKPEEESSEEEEEEEDNNEEEQEEESESEEEDGENEGEDNSDAQPDLNAELAAKDEEIASLKAQLAELETYKNAKILEEKEEVIEAYSKKLSDEEIADFKKKINDYASAADLKKEIAVCILDKESGTEETDESANYTLVGNRKEKLTGAAAIVAQYVKNK